MVIKPKVRGFVCVTAHPGGCAAQVQEQIDYVKAKIGRATCRECVWQCV